MKLKLYTIFMSMLMTPMWMTQASEQSKTTGIGFTSSIEKDLSRPSTQNGQPGRLIQINMWYPAESNQSSPQMSFADYLVVKSNEMGETNPKLDHEKTLENYLRWPISQGADKALLGSLSFSDLSMKAAKDLTILPGKHPVILLVHGSAVDFAFLAESLVEQGYVVVNVPIKGYLQQELDVNGIGMETETRDFEFALSILSTNPHLKLSDVTAIGFSFGGQSALSMACRNPMITAVVSYDGGIGDRFGARLINQTPFCSIEHVSASIMHIYDTSYSQAYLDKIRSFVYAERVFVGLENIAHWHFTSFGHLDSHFPGFFGEHKFSKKGFETILNITDDFLNLKAVDSKTPYKLPPNGYDLVKHFERLEPIKPQQ